MREKAGFFLSAESDDLRRFTFFHKCRNDFLFGPPEVVGGGGAEGKWADLNSMESKRFENPSERSTLTIN